MFSSVIFDREKARLVWRRRREESKGEVCMQRCAGTGRTHQLVWFKVFDRYGVAPKLFLEGKGHQLYAIEFCT
jgi:hypothetical protein